MSKDNEWIVRAQRAAAEEVSSRQQEKKDAYNEEERRRQQSERELEENKKKSREILKEFSSLLTPVLNTLKRNGYRVQVKTIDSLTLHSTNFSNQPIVKMFEREAWNDERSDGTQWQSPVTEIRFKKRRKDKEVVLVMVVVKVEEESSEKYAIECDKIDEVISLDTDGLEKLIIFLENAVREIEEKILEEKASKKNFPWNR